MLLKINNRGGASPSNTQGEKSMGTMTEENYRYSYSQYGWTIARCSPGPGSCENYDQSALPWEVVKAHSWDRADRVCETYAEAEAWARKATEEANRYWHARMSR